MATIRVCDFPGCGEVIAEHPDRLRMSFAMLKIDAMLDARDRGEGFEGIAAANREIADDPDSLTKELCREHALHVRSAIAEIFS